MSTVIPLPVGHVEIDAGVVTRSARYEPGTVVYFVDLVEPDGSALGVWDGPGYAEALQAAREWGLPVRDKVAS